MKPNIFQKIEFLVYLSIIILICIYYVPYQSNNYYTFHSNIMNDGYGTMSYFRFLIYLVIPTLSFYFIYKYLDGMNSIEPIIYKKKAKKELYVFFIFIGVVMGSILFLYVKNNYTEIKKERFKSQISVINNSFDNLREDLSKRPSFVYEILKDNVDEYGIIIKPPFNPNMPYEEVLEKGSETQTNNFVPPADGTVLEESKKSSDQIVPPLPKGFIAIKKPAKKLDLDLSGYYEARKKSVDNVLKQTSNFRFSENRKTQLERNINQLIQNESSSEDINNMIIEYVKIFSEVGIKKTKLELEIKELKIYDENDIKFYIVFAFLGSFILLYIIRLLFTMFNGMLKEVR